MREDIDVGPAGEVELRPRRQEVETGLGKRCPPLARQHPVQHIL